ncbi:isoprenylcysteine carboxylmethyltransferase family protein [Oceaniovalibus sp. ACAM 378]|uniref:methyltransferase family protein n=1 Tax=Oceaniovalibus sp. ACAM 378 TaxID=2599923 RepID=UPI00165233E9|nr:isoprenylcysteine carboxylmethyltransferase family protein [Oceaniovalibus sp. ACAM 378]
MISPFGWSAIAVLLLYLALFFWGGAMAARAAGRSIWLFGQATGRDWLAAVGFRAAFALAALGPLVWLALSPLRSVDPLWTGQGSIFVSFAGHLLAILGAMIAFATQMAMGASWRVGVDPAAAGSLVSGGLYEISRNPTFAGQLMLLVGVALALPSLPAVIAVFLFWLSANAQIRSEEHVLETALGAPYLTYRAQVPRWIGRPGSIGKA